MKFNEAKSPDTATRNLAGGTAYVPDDPHRALSMVVLNNLLEDTYYETDAESYEKILGRFESLAAERPEAPLEIAAWARQETYVRDVPQLILVLSAHHVDSRKYVREYAPYIIDRADELNTVLAINNWFVTGRSDDFSASVPSSIKRALADIIESGKFDEYQYAKYRQDNRAVSLKDVFNVAHPFGWDDSPDPTHEQSRIANRITKGEKDDYPGIAPLRQHRTWENKLSEMGNTADVWEGILPEMGLFAVIRNLRNMFDVGVPADVVLEHLDVDRVRDSQIYPFRFYQAAKALRHAGYRNTVIHTRLEEMIDVAAENVPDELTNTATLVDLSGSMDREISAKSTITRMEIGALFGAMLGVRGADVIGFGDIAKPFEIIPGGNTMTLQDRLLHRNVGSSTFAHKALQLAVEQHLTADRVVMFTDFQIWESGRFGNDPSQLRYAWERYRGINENAHLYIVDLASYGYVKMPPDYPNVTNIQGWNDNVLDYIWHREEL